MEKGHYETLQSQLTNTRIGRIVIHNILETLFWMWETKETKTSAWKGIIVEWAVVFICTGYPLLLQGLESVDPQIRHRPLLWYSSLSLTTELDHRNAEKSARGYWGTLGPTQNAFFSDATQVIVHVQNGRYKI